MEETRTRAGLHRALAVLVALASVVALLLQPGTAHAAVRQDIPDEQAGPPYYARLITDVRGTEDVSAVVFYRNPACVPEDFNLLEFFDIPASFACQLTVEGFVIWRNGPPPMDQAPIQQELFEADTVPVWFVSTSELQAATQDGVLTIAELRALSSLVTGSATTFHETLHPTGGATRPMLQINASGALTGGGTFRLHGVAAVFPDLRNAHATIQLS